MSYYQLPVTLSAELDEFEKDLQASRQGQIDPVVFKAIRVSHGVYEERLGKSYMVRVRCAAGGLTPVQLVTVSELSQSYGAGKLHFTTRQEVQIHGIKHVDIIAVLHALKEIGLSSRGGGGNTIRNILTPDDSGVSPAEAFDVDPYAVALTSRMIAEEDSWNLPRKIKIAFSNSQEDKGLTQTTCLGFVATHNGDKKGFAVYCGGGLGAKPMIGEKLLDFVPAEKVYQVTRAIKSMYDKYGSRRNRHINRLKFLWKKLGRKEFSRLFLKEYDHIKDNKSMDLVIQPLAQQPNIIDISPESAEHSYFPQWQKRYVSEQKQLGLYTVLIPLRLGDFSSKDGMELGKFLEKIGDNSFRCSREQNVRLRNIPGEYLGNVFNLLRSLETISDGVTMTGKIISCNGTQACKAGICQSGGLSEALRKELSNSELDLDLCPEFRINISGCPNGCGMHAVGDLGFAGRVGRKDKHPYPVYRVFAGANLGKAGKTVYGRVLAELPAKNIPQFTKELLGSYLGVKEKFHNFSEYLEQEGQEGVQRLVEVHSHIPGFEESPTHYFDFGSEEKYSLEHMGKEECSASMFDLIDVDRRHIRENKKQLNGLRDEKEKGEILFNLFFYTCRMLLVTRGVQVKEDKQVFTNFNDYFIQTSLISKRFEKLITFGEFGLKSDLLKLENMVFDLADEVVKLYERMDDSLKFREEDSYTVESNEDIVFKDLRGVVCPMNFVNTKVALAHMEAGDKLSVYLDDGKPIENVPASVQLEGHVILESKRVDNYWEVLIEKH